MNKAFEGFSPHSRVWVYQPSRPLTAEEQEYILTTGKTFAQNWTAHNNLLKAELVILQNFFIVIAVDIAHNDVSGCGIDKSVHFMQEAGKHLDINFFDRIQIAYQVGNNIKTESLATIKGKIESGELNGETPVYINTYQTLSEFQAHWPMPLNESFLWKKANVKETI